MSSKTILILGGSYGGISTAHYTLKHVIPSLPDPETYRVVLVSSSSHFFCRPTCPRALVSETAFPRDKQFVPLSRALEQYPSSSLTVLHATVENLDHASQVVEVISSGNNERSSINYHALIIATGARTVSPLLGLSGDHTRTEEAWALFQKKLPTASSIIIAGAGPSGVETAGELGEHLNGSAGGFLFSRKHESPKVKITLITASTQVLPSLPSSLGEKAEAQLAGVGVSVIKGRRIETAAPPTAGVADDNGSLQHITDSVTVTLDNGETLEADLYIPAMGFSPNTKFIAPQLLDNEGFVQVDNETLRVPSAGPRVYAIGDVSSFKPRAIHNIFTAVPVVCENLRRELVSAQDENVEYRVYKPDLRPSQLVPIGKRGVGMGFGYRMPSCVVWLIKGRDYWLSMTTQLWNGQQWAKPS